MQDSILNNCLSVARDAVQAAGDMIRKLRPDARIRAPKFDGDLLTDGDVASQKIILDSVTRHFPDHGFISEECDSFHPHAEYVWIIDPIDGTKYYNGKVLPLYAVSLALRHRNELVLGIVYAPEFDSFYSAAKGVGSTLNGKPVRCSTASDIRDATICLEIPNHLASTQVQALALKRMGEIISRAFRVRIIGVGSLGLCFCATPESRGGFDAYVNLGEDFDPVDYAGGWVVAREAGAEVEGTDRYLMAGSPAICRQLREILEFQQ